MTSVLGIEGIQQVALTSTGLDEAQTFYEEGLGLRMIARSGRAPAGVRQPKKISVSTELVGKHNFYR
jgi:catechol 2,3-dioxygenase-like lactoylglutathione lyase family enzyme